MAVNILIGAGIGGIIILLVLILLAQKKIDAPYGGTIVVEEQDDGPALVYLDVLNDPSTYKDRQDMKLKVRVLKLEQKEERKPPCSGTGLL